MLYRRSFETTVKIRPITGSRRLKSKPWLQGTSAFSKTSLNIWKFMVHILLKPGLENFKHYFTSMWDESITMNKVIGGDRILSELFQILKDDAVKVLHSKKCCWCLQIWKTQQWPKVTFILKWMKVKRSVFIPIPKKGNAKECSNDRTIDSSHMLVK